jgi:hypothetical protein
MKISKIIFNALNFEFWISETGSYGEFEPKKEKLTAKRKRHVNPKCWYLFTKQHGVVFQNTMIFS